MRQGMVALESERSKKNFADNLRQAQDAKGLASFGTLLEPHCGWLFLLARLEIDGRLQAKLDPEDLVQETLLQACRSRGDFRGRTEQELAAWLRGILAHVIAHEVRRWRRAQKRDVDLEVASGDLERSSRGIGARLAPEGASPSARAIREEESFLLARALAVLPEDYREVITLRSLRGFPYEEVAMRMERSPGAVRMLWLRARSRLKAEAEKNGKSSRRAP